MLLIVHVASFLMVFLGLLSSAARDGSTLQLSTVWVWFSSPVTMLPMMRRAGMTTWLFATLHVHIAVNGYTVKASVRTHQAQRAELPSL